MPALKAHRNPRGAVLTVDGDVVGGIELTAKGVYTVDTKGKIPAIDGLSGASTDDACKAVSGCVMGGGVTYYRNISSVDIIP